MNPITRSLITIVLMAFPLWAAWDSSDFSNTTTIQIDATDLELSGTVTDFPLMVKVEGSNLENFFGANTNNNGHDIRFTDSRGNLLKFELESWDDVAEKAAFWVLVPEMGTSITVLHIHWNWNAAPDASSPDQVFAPENDYVGVWHFNDNASGKWGSYYSKAAFGSSLSETEWKWMLINRSAFARFAKAALSLRER